MKSILYTIFSFLFFVAFIGLSIWKPFLVLLISFLIVLVGLTAYRLDIGWYIFVFLAPMISWQIHLSDYRWVWENFPALQGVYASAADFWCLVLLAAFGVHQVYAYLVTKPVRFFLPGLGWYMLFLTSALLSIIHLNGAEWPIALKYIFRFIVFFYLAYVCLGVTIIRDKKILEWSLKIFAGVGFLAAFMGAASLVLGVWHSGVLRRAVPFAIGGFMPFGDQHIFLAEVITSALPVYVYFWLQEKDKNKKFWWAVGTIFVLLISLLTFSRAAWVTLILGFAVLLYLLRQQISFKKLFLRFRWSIGLILPLFFYLIFFMVSSKEVASSTNVRVFLTEIAVRLFVERPIFGVGAGTFVSHINDTLVFVIEFGDGVDAHGYGQKLLAEQGIVGLLSFLFFVGWILMRIFKRMHDQKYTKEARIAGWMSFFLVLSPLIFQLFNTQYYSSRVWLPITLAIAWAVIAEENHSLEKMLVNFKKKVLSVRREI